MDHIDQIYMKPGVIAKELRITPPYLWNFISQLKLDITLVAGKRMLYRADEERLRAYVKQKIAEGKSGPRILVYGEDVANEHAAPISQAA